MDITASTSISVNLKEGTAEICGSESFVEKNVQYVFNFLEKNLSSQIISAQPTVSSSTSVPVSESINTLSTASNNTNSSALTEQSDKYIQAGVYHIDPEDGTISILKKVPGNNKAEKTKNIALIVLYIRKSKIPGKEIIPLCEKHVCYDSSNFSSIFKNEKTNIIRKGTGQNWTIELTQPGEKAAIALLEEMANDTK